MIIGDLYIISVTVSPNKTYPILIVYANAVLTLAISRERFEAIARKNRQVAQLTRAVQLHQFALGYPGDVLKAANTLAVE